MEIQVKTQPAVGILRLDGMADPYAEPSSEELFVSFLFNYTEEDIQKGSEELVSCIKSIREPKNSR